MRIIIVTTSYPSGDDDASGHFVQTEARALVREGHEVVVVTPGIPGRSNEQGVVVERLPHGEAFGAPGALYRISEKPQRLLGAWQFVREARAFLRRSRVTCRGGHWYYPVVAHRTCPACRTGIRAHGSDCATASDIRAAALRSLRSL